MYIHNIRLWFIFFCIILMVIIVLKMGLWTSSTCSVHYIFLHQICLWWEIFSLKVSAEGWMFLCTFLLCNMSLSQWSSLSLINKKWGPGLNTLGTPCLLSFLPRGSHLWSNRSAGPTPAMLHQVSSVGQRKRKQREYWNLAQCTLAGVGVERRYLAMVWSPHPPMEVWRHSFLLNAISLLFFVLGDIPM